MSANTIASRRSNMVLRLLEAGRGLVLQDGIVSEQQKPLRYFPLQAKHLGSVATIPNHLPTPVEFHAKLCNLIRGASHRVYLASLYVGPGVSSESVKERELLDCLSAIPNHVHVKILLDKNRALRPVPLSDQSATTSSAEAVQRCLDERSPTLESSHNQLRLFQVLPKFLPNPYDEITGVFHVKLYIIDDALIISGANLSEEYFCDRQDRYFLVQEGGAGLVDCYASMVEALCDYAQPYVESAADGLATRISKDELMQLLAKILTTDIPDDDDTSSKDDGNTAAFAIPTFQAPAGFYTQSKVPFLSDVEATRKLLTVAAAAKEVPSHQVVRISTAYLNPTKGFVNALSQLSSAQLLTAGRVSHGFAPKKKAGNKGKDWIPSFFDKLSTGAARDIGAKLLYYERPDWTFHAKGLWLSTEDETNEAPSAVITNPESLVAAVCGSGNFGSRSERLDMESNCLLILPNGSPLKASLAGEWNDLCEFVQEQQHGDLRSSDEPPPSLPLSIQVLFPLIRDFF